MEIFFFIKFENSLNILVENYHFQLSHRPTLYGFGIQNLETNCILSDTSSLQSTLVTGCCVYECFSSIGAFNLRQYTFYSSIMSSIIGQTQPDSGHSVIFAFSNDHPYVESLQNVCKMDIYASASL